VHWVLYDLAGDVRELHQGQPARERIPAGATQGRNDFGKFGYGGPAPPRGKPHRYFFRLYALDAALGLGPGARAADLRKAMEGRVLGTAELMGTYRR
jgi:Raf kinase inhibitor-like YbhB/YbcL family protein